MISATKETLNVFFTGNLRFIVPFFQRSYVWKQENWETLWDHLLKVSERQKQSVSSEHFIGTIMTKEQETKRIGQEKKDLIDGQQRLTTFSILLKAIATTTKGNGDYTKLKAITNAFVVIEDSKGKKYARIEHSKNDREYFEAVMFDADCTELKNQDHGILKSYRFFLDRLKDFSDEQLDGLKDLILSNVSVISMLLSASDDEQEMFDTINSLGARLTTGELLKNFIFKEKAIQHMYEPNWSQVFEEDDDVIRFWNREKTAGRVKRNNMELLLYCYLIIKTKSEVKLEELFKEYKKWLGEKSIPEKTEFLEELKEYAKLYRNFPEGTQLNEIAFADDEKRFFHVIENLEITTVYPLVLYIYKNLEEEQDKFNNLKRLEAYLVRRNICGLTTKNYNNLFIQIIRNIEAMGGIAADSLDQVLSDFTEDSNKFPQDIELREAFLEEDISNANAREILFCIALYQLNNGYQDRTKLSAASYSVEHILPQKWEEHWEVGSVDENFKLNRRRKLKTLGNLTLVTRQLNSKLKNASWEKKKTHFREYSLLKITTPYLELPIWNESTIDGRASDLSAIALDVWKRNV